MAFGNPANINVTVSGGSASLPNVWAKPVIINRNTANTAQMGDIGTDAKGNPTLLDDYVSLTRVSSSDGFTYSNTMMGTQTTWTQQQSNLAPGMTASYSGIAISDGAGGNTTLNQGGLTFGSTGGGQWTGGIDLLTSGYTTLLGPTDSNGNANAIGIPVGTSMSLRPQWGQMNIAANKTSYPHGNFSSIFNLLLNMDFNGINGGPSGNYLSFPSSTGSPITVCWITTSQTMALSSTYNNLYTGTWTWTFPFTKYQNAPAVMCTQFTWGTGGSWGTVTGSSATTATLRGFDNVTRASGSVKISAIAIGI